jgi:hypothetical protein
MKKSILVSLLALLMMGCQVSGGSSLKVEETTVEMRKNPEGVAVSAPRFSWQLVTDKQDVMQTAYQIEVADSEKGLQAGSGLVWNSGRVESGQSDKQSASHPACRLPVAMRNGEPIQLLLRDSSAFQQWFPPLSRNCHPILDSPSSIGPTRRLK